jgi:NAD(P)-dependent dehydrogenase (short-subunit alcohol dehydrogenase family)
MVDPFEMSDVAVVTGGGSGIGRALCRALAETGIRRLVVADLNHKAATEVAEAINRSSPCRAVALEFDIADSRLVEVAISGIEAEIGSIGLWCSNAGVHIGEGVGDLADWRKSLDVNLMGHVNAARSVIPRMKKRGQGYFVITASAAGLLTDLRCAPYAASKHAAVALAEWLAITHGDDGIAVFCVCPEGVRTGMTKASSLKAGIASGFLEPEEVARTIIAAIRERRFLVLPHPRVAEYEQRRTADRDSWLDRMRAVRRKLTLAMSAANAT